MEQTPSCWEFARKELAERFQIDIPNDVRQAWILSNICLTKKAKAGCLVLAYKPTVSHVGVVISPRCVSHLGNYGPTIVSISEFRNEFSQSEIRFYDPFILPN